jgi:hypothetical protein
MTEESLKNIEKLLQEVIDNGHKCKDHEEHVRTVSWLKGGFGVMLLLLGFISVTNYNTLGRMTSNTATLNTLKEGVQGTSLELSSHEEQPAHVIAEQWFLQNQQFHNDVLSRFVGVEQGQKETNKKLDRLMTYHTTER